ncbi:ABC transporter permease [Novosphingobium sp. PY1]|uniref:ABC transporter permease n=1 Tax=Novosphingobium sp. PY1 TaxID=1882221 RepID=UPI000BE78AEA|nr:FtsX-like permease family protein [Novosphingobium sp. PY1]BBA74127.1 lipoprotein-releasing system permease [Novosphingobium sp. PY1]GFM31364.1 lipoprotein-releasing system permease [Novosphingobium sp. PY1]
MIGRAGFLVTIALRHLARRRRQTAVAVSGVAVGVGFFLAVSALMVGSQNDFVEQLINAAPHIIVSDELRSPSPQPGARAYGKGAVALYGYKVRSEVRGIKDWQAVVSAANSVPGAIASPSLTGGVTLRLGGHDEAIGIVGVEPDIEKKISTIEDKLRVGHLHDLETTQGGIIIGEDLAARLGVQVGDIVAATSSSSSGRSMRVVGLFKKGQTQLSSGTGYVLLREAQSLLGRPFIINRIGVKLVDPYAAEAVAARLESRFGYKAESWQERSADILSLLLTRNVIMYSVVSAILLVASFGIYTVVSNNVSDKRRDIAIMRSMGFSEGDLQFIFVVEGLVLAVIGVLLGWLLGYGLMTILGTLRFPIGGDVERIPMDRSARQYAIAALVSLLAGSLAAWLPARKAARVDPVDILRGAL